MLLHLGSSLYLLCFAHITVVSASCLNNILHDTIGFFGGAPITFGYDYPTASHCAIHCNQLEDCRAWLYVVPGDCQLYRNAAIATASNPNFFYGVCSGTSSIASPSSSALPTPNLVADGNNHISSHENDLQKHKQRRHKRHEYSH